VFSGGVVKVAVVNGATLISVKNHKRSEQLLYKLNGYFKYLRPLIIVDHRFWCAD
jgi:hypothetical protein